MNYSEEKITRGRSVDRSPEVHRANAEAITALHSKGYTIGQVAKEANLPRSYVKTVMDVLHLKRRGGSPTLQGVERQYVKDAIRDLRLQGMSNPYISNKLGVTTSQVIFLIRELRTEGRLPKDHIPFSQSAEIADALKGE